jgi:dGTPase
MMREWGGFEHNRQSLRVVEVIEHRYPGFRGPTHGRRAVRGNTTATTAPTTASLPTCPGPLRPARGPGDEIAFTAADTYDALAAGWIPAEQLVS